MGDVTQKQARLISCVRFSRIIPDLAGEFEHRCYANGRGSDYFRRRNTWKPLIFPVDQ